MDLRMSRPLREVIPFFAFPPVVRKVIYTTNAIESVNARLRKIIKARGHFPSDEADTLRAGPTGCGHRPRTSEGPMATSVLE